MGFIFYLRNNTFCSPSFTSVHWNNWEELAFPSETFLFITSCWITWGLSSQHNCWLARPLASAAGVVGGLAEGGKHKWLILKSPQRFIWRGLSS